MIRRQFTGTDGMINCYDNFIEERVATMIGQKIFFEKRWHYDWPSLTGGVSKHWNIFAGESEIEIEYIKPIWQMINSKYPELKLERSYLNAHTHGIEPHIHRDDGDITFIYYPIMDWKPEWGGGTVLFNNDVELTHHFAYKGNRLIMFPASILHQAQSVSRECYELRTCVVFKTARI